jgi:hypothetical protein
MWRACVSLRHSERYCSIVPHYSLLCNMLHLSPVLRSAWRGIYSAAFPPSTPRIARVTRLPLLPLGALHLLTAGCHLLPLECDRGSERHTYMVATVSDTSGSNSVDAWLALGENRDNQNSTHSVGVNVQSVAAPIPKPAPAALLGHVSRARFELSDGTPIYETPLTGARFLAREDTTGISHETHCILALTIRHS